MQAFDPSILSPVKSSVGWMHHAWIQPTGGPAACTPYARTERDDEQVAQDNEFRHYVHVP